MSKKVKLPIVFCMIVFIWWRVRVIRRTREWWCCRRRISFSY